MSKMKNGCVTELTSEMHAKYDVHNLPYQNLNPTHPMRLEWESKEVEDAEFEKRDIRKFGDCKSEVAMRPSDKVNGREFSLSYGKLVRSTAIQANAAKVENTLESVTEYVTGL